MPGATLTDAEVVGALIARERKIKGITQAELAQLISVGERWIGRMERGCVELSTEQLSALCARLDIDPETVAGLPMLTRSAEERRFLIALRRIRTDEARHRAFLVINSIGALQENASC